MHPQLVDTTTTCLLAPRIKPSTFLTYTLNIKEKEGGKSKAKRRRPVTTDGVATVCSGEGVN
jgi:hypothetical protein